MAERRANYAERFFRRIFPGPSPEAEFHAVFGDFTRAVEDGGYESFGIGLYQIDDQYLRK